MIAALFASNVNAGQALLIVAIILALVAAVLFGKAAPGLLVLAIALAVAFAGLLLLLGGAGA